MRQRRIMSKRFLYSIYCTRNETSFGYIPLVVLDSRYYIMINEQIKGIEIKIQSAPGPRGPLKTPPGGKRRGNRKLTKPRSSSSEDKNTGSSENKDNGPEPYQAKPKPKPYQAPVGRMVLYLISH